MNRGSVARWRHVVGGALIAGALAGATGVHGQQAPAVTTAAEAGVRTRDLAEARLERQRAANQRALFASEEPLPFTLVADFKAVNRDRNPDSTKTFPATLVVAGRNGGEDRIPVNIRTRGHSRRLSVTCTFAPIRLEFPGKTQGTVFEGHKSLKLGTHCRDVDSYEQYVYREYLAYKLFNRITARSFRARLAAATYVDASTSRPVASRAGLFIEDDDDVARRLGGETTELHGMTFANVDGESMATLGLFEYMIGNTDVSLFKLHNIVAVRAGTGVVYPVPYDFDYSGLVNARYAVPEKALNLSTVRERLYRGPCMTQETIAPLLSRLHSLRGELMGLFDTVAPLDDRYRKDARAYLDEFFHIIEKPGDVKRAFIEGCKRSTM
jgi:hypothetical protein